MKIKPILFSTEMVQAILEGRKNQTRRVLNPQPLHRNPFWKIKIGKEEILTTIEPSEIMNSPIPPTSPYGNIGDILWVRESFTKVEFKDQPTLYLYKANPDHQSMKWKPSIHMPKEACRLFLKVTNVRVERLKDILENDAIAEGVDKKGELYYDYYSEIPQVGRDFYYKIETAKISFMGLWCKIKGVDSWRSNPFVWVIEFERIEKPENF